ncbi:MAG: glycine zipper 2TM domain-containing protein [Caulobacter sp.]|uniref:glycine zipper 2TM domain-containing protein n=1 Tax=unclassified Caulobacter TaxID=2648921 RepID=UPI000D73D4E2|nr:MULTISPECIES: glycine zipper 2TM domain-containing protein [unclassified Caulobacter]PXA85597.1 hypothetical protein DMC25_15100 [Caulobacter sp. D4A]PXA95229.1 hypothetical protein DMC18_04455 [Caulobacter sp. D5]
MRAQMKTLIVAVSLAFTASTVAVTVAEAQQRRERVLVCKSTKKARNKGTVIGGLSGGALGAAVAGNGAKTEGAILGGVVGAVAGNQIAKHNSKKNCHYEYRYR